MEAKRMTENPNPRIGRPRSVDPFEAELATERLVALFTPGQATRVRIAAKETGVPVSEFIRRAVLDAATDVVYEIK
jgi:hypothetical protein